MGSRWDPDLSEIFSMHKKHEVDGEVNVCPDPKKVARHVIHRCNNFLAFMLTRAETALISNNAEELRVAMQELLAESEKLGTEMRKSRESLGD